MTEGRNSLARAQQTLKESFSLKGVGLHSGTEVQVTVKPAPADHGIVFQRVDLDGAPAVKAEPQNLDRLERRSALRDGKVTVSTVEHLLAAFYGLRIDNALVEVVGDEIPGLDGSARPFVEAIREAGIVELKAQRKTLRLESPLVVQDGDVSIVALPAGGGLSIDYHLAEPEGGGFQSVSFVLSPESFEAEIAPARTFVAKAEVEALLEAGLGKGASRENTLVLGPAGPENGETRLPDEAARHKILDLLGDLALSGLDLEAKVIATRSGHRTNHEFVRALLERCRRLEEEGYLARDSGMNIRDILELLPHRYPFLLVDRVLEFEGYRRAVGIKNVTINEPFFQGHWPGQPIMPGVLQLEAMAQMSGILLFRKLENTGKLAVLWSIDKVKFRGAVVPGDQLRIEVETIRSRPGMGHVQARCKVGGKLVSEAQLKFTLVDA